MKVYILLLYGLLSNFKANKIGDSTINYDETTQSSISDNTDGTSTIETTTGAGCQVPDAINVQVVDKGTTFFTISWDSPISDDCVVDNYEITIKAIRPNYNQEDSNCTEPDVEEIFNDTTTIYNFTDAWPSYTYNVSIVALYSTGESSEYIEVTTNNAEPSAPVVNVSDTGSSFFTLSWNPPDYTHSCGIATVDTYTITINIIESNYPQLNSSCPAPSDIEPISLNGTDITYNFTDAWPSYRYNVSISGLNSIGETPPGYIEVITLYSEPEAPYIIALDVSDTGDNNISGNLSWNDPCKINGIISRYRIKIHKEYTEDTNSSATEHITTEKYLSFSLEPSHIYSMEVSVELDNGITGYWAVVNHTTAVGYPGLPGIEVSNVYSQRFTIKSLPPLEKTGPIERYDLRILFVQPLNERSPFCSPYVKEDVILYDVQIEYSEENAIPYSSYEVKIRAKTSKGYGNYSVKTVDTLPAVPDNVEVVKTSINNTSSEDYNATFHLKFNASCNMYGDFVSYTVNCIGEYESYSNVIIEKTYDEMLDDYNLYFNLSPEYKYTCNINTKNSNFTNVTYVDSFVAPSGVPGFSVDVHSIPIENISPNSAEIILRKEYLDMTQGTVLYIALILSTDNIETPGFEKWDESQSWPNISSRSRQITPDLWNPFKDTNESIFIVGNGSVENPALADDKQYYLTIRIFTNSFYRNSQSIVFRTEKISKVGMIVGILFALLLLAGIGVSFTYIWKKKLYRQWQYIYREKLAVPAPVTTVVPISKFIKVFKQNQNNPEVFKNQFALLDEQSKEIQAQHTTKFAELPQNRGKNRYTNILPYDAYRVQLLIDEDDEMGSDYINASYITGYSGDVEYIATQGPLLKTCSDFWKLVIQENVTIIVMVSNFVENHKQKCHKYFPDNHENIIFGNNIEIRCATELNFGEYVIRSLQVRKGETQTMVTHMQFLKWPDCGVPTGTEHILQFCYHMRERVKTEGGLIMVHCSAGVGRTGTLIATDILLQTANAKRPLDVHNTILELRRKRVMMVQTEVQYTYIHRLIADHLERPICSDKKEVSEHSYENVDSVKRRSRLDKIKVDDSKF